MRIALIGADGQLGTDLLKVLAKDTVLPLYYPEFDITLPQKMREVLLELEPDVVINTAAFNRVDECEDTPLPAFLVNSLAVRDLSIICKEIGCVLVHFSTDYVFDGEKKVPYREEDPPNPLNVYGVSKLAGELFIRNILDRYFLIRTCGLYGEAGSKEKGYNFVDGIISHEKQGKSLRIVDDQRVTPTSTLELAQKISELMRTSHFGLFHMTNEGECTWYEFARTIFTLLGRPSLITPVDSTAYSAKARRPFYSVLDNKRANEIGLSPFSHWRIALETYLRGKSYI